MRCWLLVFCVMAVSISISAQTTPPSSGSGNNGGSQTRTTPAQENQQINSRYETLRAIDIMRDSQKPNENVLREEIEPLYRKPGKKELKNLQPSDALLAQYDQFLKQSDTGVFKLSADSSCVENAAVVVAADNCMQNGVPGAGTAYSFRVKSHRLLHLADLVLDKDVFRTGSLLQQGIMVSLGNIELDKISADSPGLKYLADITPKKNQDELQRFEETLSRGIKVNGFIYSYGLYVKDKTTFALRSIAYRGKLMRSVKGVKYNEFDYDKRGDVTVVFRVIEKGANGDLTILWKEISHKESPVIKIEEK